MRRTKGVNWLAELVAQEQAHRLYLLPTHIAQAAARHRALEAVARAAEAYKNRWGIVIVHKDGDAKEGKALARALARLSRAGRAKGERRG